MFAVIDKKIPKKVKNKLAGYFNIIEFYTDNIVYPSISGHPDIFIFQKNELLILAPDIPEIFINKFKQENISFIIGNKRLGSLYPYTVYYNAVCSDKYLIHTLKYTDKKIISNCSDKKFLQVKQGYTRCNLIHLKNNAFITSDMGIMKELIREKASVLYIDPSNILLSGQEHGFFGGTCGLLNNMLYMMGSLKYIKNSSEVIRFLTNHDIEIVELYEGPLFDGGGIIFI